MTRRRWTEAEDRVMREFYPRMRAVDVAEVLKRTERSIYARADLLGLEKAPEFLASDLSGRVVRGKLHPAMQATQFQPGITPWNKGKHYVAGGRSAETRFKPGRPACEARNYRPIGSQRVNREGLLEQKVTDDPGMVPARRWVGVHRLVWEAAHGPVPAGHIVRFRDGMRTTVAADITVDRLECITRAENARRNDPKTRDPEVGRLIQLKGAITRQVNRIAREAQQKEKAT